MPLVRPTRLGSVQRPRISGTAARSGLPHGQVTGRRARQACRDRRARGGGSAPRHVAGPAAGHDADPHTGGPLQRDPRRPERCLHRPFLAGPRAHHLPGRRRVLGLRPVPRRGAAPCGVRAGADSRRRFKPWRSVVAVVIGGRPASRWGLSRRSRSSRQPKDYHVTSARRSFRRDSFGVVCLLLGDGDGRAGRVDGHDRPCAGGRRRGTARHPRMRACSVRCCSPTATSMLCAAGTMSGSPSERADLQFTDAGGVRRLEVDGGEVEGRVPGSLHDLDRSRGGGYSGQQSSNAQSAGHSSKKSWFTEYTTNLC